MQAHLALDARRPRHPVPPLPDTSGTVNFSLDFDRHGRKLVGNSPTDPSMNMLYVDGHAAFVSCRQAYKAILFQ